MDRIALAFHQMALALGGLKASACGLTFDVIKTTANSDDALLGTADSVTGQELILKVLVSDCPDLKNRTPIAFNGKNYRVKSMRLIGAGTIARVFLEDAR